MWAGQANALPAASAFLPLLNFSLHAEFNHGRFGCLRRSSRHIFNCLSNALGIAVTTLPHKFAVIVFAKFTEPDWAGHCDTHAIGVAEEERTILPICNNAFHFRYLRSSSHCHNLVDMVPTIPIRV